MIGPWAEPISEWRRVAIAGATTDATPPELWPIVEEIGVEFDRISAGCDDCDRAILAGKLAKIRNGKRHQGTLGDLRNPWVS